MSTLQRLGLLTLLLMAFALRLYQLDKQSLWYDEGVTATITRYPPTQLIAWTANDIQPPLYYLVVAAWGRVAGWSEWSLRFPSACFGLLLVPLLAYLAHILDLTSGRWANTSSLAKNVLPTSRRSTGASLLAALFTTLHPLLVYYSQEARMYTLLVTLGVLLAICDLRSTTGRRHKLWGIGYLVAATAALYTHYFALFLLVALGLWRFASERLSSLRSFLLTNTVVFLLYFPWLWIMLGQLHTDRSYWPGELKRWEALRQIAIHFTLGRSVQESQATPYLWLFAVLSLILLSIGLYRASSRLATRYSLFWLLIPILLLLLLASFTPKFNARYAIIALPGLIVLWSLCLAHLLPPHPFTLSRTTLLLSLIPLFFAVTSLRSLSNWFFDSAFTKDQWRELAQTVQQQIQPNEKVVLVSGHAWPIWQYYAPDLSPVRLPEIDILDVSATLDYPDSAHSLHEALAGASGAWLINWQADVIDPTDMAGFVLGLAGDEQPVNAQFWGLRLRHFTNLQPIQERPPIATPLNANLDNQLTLLGYSQNTQDELLLFWQSGTTTPTLDFKLTGELRTQENLPYHSIQDQRLAGYIYPTFHWRASSLVVGRLSPVQWSGAGALPGAYRLSLGVYDPAGDPAGLDILDQQGNAIGKRLLIDLTLHAVTPALAIADVGKQPSLVQITSSSPTTIEPGQPVTLRLRWYRADATSFPTPFPTPFRWVWRSKGNAAYQQAMPFSLEPSAMTQWPIGQPIRQVLRLASPFDMPTGDGELALVSATGDLGTLPVQILPSTRRFAPPPMESVFNASFNAAFGQAQEMMLLGASELLPLTTTTNAPLSLTLIWQAGGAWQPSTTDYVVSLQWLDQEGRLVTQTNQALPKGTSSWIVQQVETQTLQLFAPTVAGRYQLIAVVYDPTSPGLQRLKLPDGQDFALLGWVEVVSS